MFFIVRNRVLKVMGRLFNFVIILLEKIVINKNIGIVKK